MTADVTFGGPRVAAVAAAESHRFSKASQRGITLVAGLGVKGDAHSGVFVEHLSDRKRDRRKANLRQVHLIERELLDDLAVRGFVVTPGELGENITTREIGLLTLGEGTLLGLGATAVVRLTGLRAPCIKIARFRKGLQKAVAAERDGFTFMIGAVMAIAVAEGDVCVGDVIKLINRVDASARPLRPV